MNNITKKILYIITYIYVIMFFLYLLGVVLELGVKGRADINAQELSTQMTNSLMSIPDRIIKAVLGLVGWFIVFPVKLVFSIIGLDKIANSINPPNLQ